MSTSINLTEANYALAAFMRYNESATHLSVEGYVNQLIAWRADQLLSEMEK